MQNQNAREVPLDADHSVTVLGTDYPWVTEWNWEYDRVLGQATRLEQGRRIILFHEILKRHKHTDTLLVLTEETFDVLYAKNPEYSRLIEAWMERGVAGDDMNILLPDPVELLSISLTGALYSFFHWKDSGRVYMFQPDKEGLTPGQIFYKRRRAVPDFEVLGGFMNEYTGQWVEAEDESDPTGLVPQDYGDLIGESVVLILDSLLAKGNNVEDTVGIWEQFEAKGLPLDELATIIHKLLQEYPCPQE
jgi:hypothetical protein